MRREQGRKLKELMQKKREDKAKLLHQELSELQQVEQGKLDGSLDLISYKEELSHRGFGSTDDFQKRISSLMLKLNINEVEEPDPQMTHSQAMDNKYHLLSIADAFLTPDQIKQKRIQKMQKTAALIREEKKRAINLAKEKLE